MKSVDTTRTYKPVPTAHLFHRCNATVKGVMGPWGSSKSTMCVMDIWMRALGQEPYNGVRKSAWAIFRSTYPELESTTLKTWKYWIPEYTPNGKPFCKINYQKPMTAHLRTPLQDGTILDMDVIFLAMDQPQDVGKINSLEITGAWINEARFFPLETLPDIKARCGRYPPHNEVRCTWSGVIMDTNPPEVDSIYYNLAEVQKPEGYKFFRQPPAILQVPNSDPPVFVPNMGQNKAYGPCENVENMHNGYGYWMEQIHGADREWIKVHLEGEYGTVKFGKPVFEHQYRDSFHCAKNDLEVFRGLPLIIGQDWGLTPSAVIGQVTNRGQLRIIDELSSDNMSAQQFGREFLLPHLRSKYGGMTYKVYCDPASTRGQADNATSINEFMELGIPIEYAKTNNLDARLGAVRKLLNSNIDGQPALIISPSCKIIRSAFQRKYHYREMRTAGGMRHALEPEKNDVSHCMDALEYVCMEVVGGINAYGAKDIEPGINYGTSQKRDLQRGDWGAFT